MIREEFIDRAYNPPYKEEPVIYRLSIDVISYDDVDGEPYDNAVLRSDVCEYFFLTLEAAQEAVRTIDFAGIAMVSCEHPYRIVVEEKPLERYSERAWSKRRWTYDKMRNLQEYEPVSSLPDESESYDRFYGLPEEKRRFEINDIVEFTNTDSELCLGLVEAVPMTPERAWELASRGQEEIDKSPFDFSDRVYVVWFGPKEDDWDYLWEYNLMPPTFAVPDHTARMFREYLESKSDEN